MRRLPLSVMFGQPGYSAFLCRTLAVRSGLLGLALGLILLILHVLLLQGIGLVRVQVGYQAGLCGCRSPDRQGAWHCAPLARLQKLPS